MSGIAAVYADGGIIETNPSTIGGTWAWCYVDAGGNRITGDSGVYEATHGPVSNNLTEYIALCRGLAGLPPGWSGQVCSDSAVTLGRLFSNWATSGIPAGWVRRATILVARLGKVQVIQLQGHPSRAELALGFGSRHRLPVSKHNVWCDQQCVMRSREFMSIRASHAS